MSDSDLLDRTDFPPPLVRRELGRDWIPLFYPGIEHETYEPDETLYIRPKAGRRARMSPVFHPKGGFDFVVNSLGMVNPYFPSKVKPPLRVLYTGASNAQGLCSFSESAVGRAQKTLRVERRILGTEILNCGCGTYNFFNFLAVLERHINLKPDAFVINAYTGNDFFGGAKIWRLFHGQNPLEPDSQAIETLLQEEEPFDGNLKAPNLVGLEISQALFLRKHPDQLACIHTHTCSITKHIKKICDDHGIKLLFMIIPGPVTGQPDRMKATRERLKNLVGLTREQTAIADRVGDNFIDFLKQEGISFKDLRPDFQNTKENLYFEIDGHINLLGQRLMAEHLVGVLGNLAQKSWKSCTKKNNSYEHQFQTKKAS